MSNRPVILDFAQSRKQSSVVPFVYDTERDISVVPSVHGNRPFIEAPESIVTLHTETRVKRESDDEEYSCSEFVTKTDVIRERDDEESCPMELLTKTEATRESDDDSPRLFAELYSKTFVDRERDDEDDIAHYQ